MTAHREFVGGPWDAKHDHVPVVIPTQRVFVYADAAPDVVCADEQVIDLLGHYERAEKLGETYVYDWRPA